MRFLRASGGVSTWRLSRLRNDPFSPRKRRCFRLQFPAAFGTKVFSAQAEVFPLTSWTTSGLLCFLRASGGVSKYDFEFDHDRLFSPRKRRCFYLVKYEKQKARVFSAQAEVFLARKKRENLSKGFLRASGGVSSALSYSSCAILFSPRKRRCFLPNGLLAIRSTVFSAQAEVFLTPSPLSVT